MMVDPIPASEAPHQAWINDDVQDRSATEGAREQEAARADAVERAAQAVLTARLAYAEARAAKAEQQALTATRELASPNKVGRGIGRVGGTLAATQPTDRAIKPSVP